MKFLRSINLSTAAIVLICFFMPWEQVSCGGARDTLSGLDLARHEQTILWLIPLLMAAVLVLGLVRRSREKGPLLAIVSAASGGVALYLMNDQRVKVHDESGVISAQLTGWFWLSFISCGAMIVSALALLFRKGRGP
jgi:threonine/homoserine efflux transporter RhtA